MPNLKIASKARSIIETRIDDGVTLTVMHYSAEPDDNGQLLMQSQTKRPQPAAVPGEPQPKPAPLQPAQPRLKVAPAKDAAKPTDTVG